MALEVVPKWSGGAGGGMLKSRSTGEGVSKLAIGIPVSITDADGVAGLLDMLPDVVKTCGDIVSCIDPVEADAGLFVLIALPWA